MKNDYEIKGEYTIIYLKRKNGEVLETIIDTEDLDRVKELPNTWHAQYDSAGNTFYVTGKTIAKKGNFNSVKLSRWIMKPSEENVIDHINHDTLDNRKINLREITQAENVQNCKGARKNSKTGVRGVHFYKPLNKYCASFGYKKKRHHLGYFDTIEEAKKVVETERKKVLIYSK